MQNKPSRLWLMSLLTAVFLLLTACSTPTEPTTTPTETTAPTQTENPTITLIENPWPASELNVRVAQILIENELQHPTEIIGLDENLQWDAIASGEADASLEVWPSGHGERIAQYIDEQGVVMNGGPLGPEGIIGWYVPTYVIDQHPELATWEGFQNPELAQLFATAETGEKGQFLAGDPSWVQYDADIINNLGLNLQVVTAGSEDALLASLSSAYSRQEPILFYFYEPHAVFSQFDLTQVTLPDYSDDCYADAENGSVACAYPSDQLLKIISPDLSQKSPAVDTLLHNMQYDNAAQISMLAALDNGATLEEAAQQWVDQNEDTWRTWLP